MNNTCNKKIPYLQTLDCVIREVNNEFVTLTGFPLEDLIGKSVTEICKILKVDLISIFVGEGEGEGHGHGGREVNQNKVNTYIFTKSHDVIEVTIICTQNNDKEKIYTFIECENSGLKDKFFYVDQLLEDNRIGVAIHSVPELRLLRANQMYLDFQDFPYNNCENGIGSLFRERVNLFQDSDAEKAFFEVIKTGKSDHFIEFEYVGFQRGITYWDTSLIPIKIDGNVKYIIQTITESTEKVLNRKIIEQQKNIIEKTLELQEEFFANISHELKTPLNIIFATAQILDMYCKEGLLDEKKTSIIEYINSIKHNSNRLSKLINNIVDLSKIDAGFYELNLSNNNIVEVVEETVMSVINYTEVKHLNIIFDTDIEEKIISCDPEKIERIILNLISNAIKFSSQDNDILVNIKDKNEYVEISVMDQGIGIDSSHMEMIFDRFKQVDKSLTRNAEGTGIGLSLVKEIVELHGGNIYVESELGKGSKFTVILPAKKVMQESTLSMNRLGNKSESIQVELSDIS